ncbi:MAG TPA: polysaccharide deacetylase family protein, partial [Gaiellaceae bacterium]|nr:polysaccharide deacetylase family protein [Gaiellaceae bacterium]
MVLCYHAVSETWNHRLSMSRGRLVEQVRLLRRLGALHVTFDDAFHNALETVVALCELGVPVTIFVCTGFADRAGAPLLIPELASEAPEDVEGLRTMTWGDLRDVVAAGARIGSHTVSHPHLPSLRDDELAAELGASRSRVEHELGRPCRVLAYPFGEHDARVREAARAAGYQSAYALRARLGDDFARPRLDLYRRHTRFRTLLETASFALS